MPGLNLTHEEAQARAKVITKVQNYDVNLYLTGEGETFRSETEIRFDAVPGGDTFLDVVAHDLVSVTLNGDQLDTSSYDGTRLPLSDLSEKNVLRLVGDFFYMNTGEGMHRSVDPEDGRTYLYTQFEVPDARRVFPTFEQPDLKASFTFHVTVPKGWTVFSVSPTPYPIDVEETDAAGQEMVQFNFAPTPRISTYVTAVVAGPYEGETETIRSMDGREIELGVYTRASLRKHLDAPFVFEVTEQGFGFFENAYGIPYPFTKYDQIFVPEFNAGAMENAGCVTIRDQFVFRSTPTAWELEELTNVILHELAHMWFGDLVTMRWWDDLWLNESFAEFMAYLAAAEATRFKDAWVGFLARKEWGMAQDQKPTTHPVRTEMKDLQDVEVNFDGITYAKGAAVLRQMVSYVGEENFFKGLHRYLTKNSWGNATLTDLLTELEETSGRDMSRWTNVWVEESGVNTLTCEVEAGDDGQITSLAVNQLGEGMTARPHRLAAGGYSLVGGEVVRTFQTEVDVEGERTEITEAVGVQRPDLILLNDGDLTYAKVRLDQASLAFAEENVGKIVDPLARRIVLASAWDMTRDGELPSHRFLALALNAAATESSVVTLDGLLDQVAVAATRYTAADARPETLVEVSNRLWDLAMRAQPSSDAQELFTKSFASLATATDQAAHIEALYTGETVLEGLERSDDLLWDLLFALVRLGRAGEEQIQQMLERDPSLRGQESAARARATVDEAAVRDATWDAIVEDVSIPNDTRWAMAAGFWAHANTQPDAYTPFVQGFYAAVNGIWETHTFHMASRILQVLNPARLAGYVGGEDVPGLGALWLEENTDQPDSLRRIIAEGKDDAERMLRAQAADEQ